MLIYWWKHISLIENKTERLLGSRTYGEVDSKDQRIGGTDCKIIPSAYSLARKLAARIRKKLLR